MKSILLASASIVAFAGAASAQAVTFGGEAELGFNDDIEDGFFYTADLNVTFAADLGGGLTSKVTFTIPVADSGDEPGDPLDSSDYVLSLEAADMGGLFYGDTAFAAETHWDAGFALATDGFSEQDNETVLRGDSKLGGFDVSLSAITSDAQGDRPGEGDVTGDERDYVDQISLGVDGQVGMFTVEMGYQEASEAEAGAVDGNYDTDNGDFNANEIIAVSAGVTFAGADLKFAVSQETPDVGDAASSYGVLVKYPLGPVKLSASYAIEEDIDPLTDEDEYSYKIGADYENGPLTLAVYYGQERGDEQYGVEGTYMMGEMTKIYAGYTFDEQLSPPADDDNEEGGYVGVRHTLSDNFYVEASYAEFDEAGPEEFRQGSTLLAGLTF